MPDSVVVLMLIVCIVGFGAWATYRHHRGR